MDQELWEDQYEMSTIPLSVVSARISSKRAKNTRTCKAPAYNTNTSLVYLLDVNIFVICIAILSAGFRF
jgi:hypothetical protein